jgi:hypothetical protein
VQAPIFLGIGMRLGPRVDDASRGRGGGRRFFMNMLRALRNKILGLPRDLQNFSGAGINLPGDEEGNQLLRHLPKIDVPAHEVVLMTTVRIAERVGVVLENVDFAGQPLFAQSFLCGGQTSLEQAFACLVVHDKVEDVVAFRGRIFGMAAGILIKTRPVHEKGVGRPTVGNQPFKDITQDFLHRQIDPAVGGKDQPIFIFKAEDSLSHTTSPRHG